jgi:hypothetical protein
MRKHNEAHKKPTAAHKKPKTKTKITHQSRYRRQKRELLACQSCSSGSGETLALLQAHPGQA